MSSNLVDWKAYDRFAWRALTGSGSKMGYLYKIAGGLGVAKALQNISQAV
jgi:hypothetical protein